MIKGIGVDITEINRIKQMVKQHPQFVERILGPGELAQYHQFKGQRAAEYLAGRWSLKESFGKAMGTGIGQTVGFHDVEIVDNQQGAPVVHQSVFPGQALASVSHTGQLVMTEVLLENNDHLGEQ